jgi:hypothetical protein
MVKRIAWITCNGLEKKVLPGTTHGYCDRFCKSRDILRYLVTEGVELPDDLHFESLMDPTSFGHSLEQLLFF